jgi:WD40 repeat protein
VTYACFSPSGGLVLTSGTDRIAKLWEFGTNELLSVFASHDASLTQASFSPDGRLITVADLKGVVNVYSCSMCGAGTKELLDLAESRKSRELTTNERRRFLCSN